MKKIILGTLLFISLASFAQDQSPIVINVRDNARLAFNGVAVKQKATVINYSPVVNTTKDFLITVVITYYVNNGGAYGSSVLSAIAADNNLSVEEKESLTTQFQDRLFTYTTSGRHTDINGNLVSTSTPSAIPEIQYWQSFKLNNASLGMTSASTQGALDAEYKIVAAIVTKMDSRKNF